MLRGPNAGASRDIGLHHIHYLSSRIPNYRLRECLEANPELREVRRLTMAESWKAIWLALWDEEQGRLVGFRHLSRVSDGSGSADMVSSDSPHEG